VTSALKILHLEDNRLDADLVEATLAADGLLADIVRVDSRAAFEAALHSTAFDVILADYNLPVFDGLSAQILAAQLRREIPFIFLSGSIGEETAVERLKDGATDYVLKDRMARLPSAIRRALAEAAERAQRRSADEHVLRLNAELEDRVARRTAELGRANEALAAREIELQEAKAFLEDLIAASPSMIFRLDPATFDIVYASPNVGWLLGYSADEIVLLPDFWARHIHPEDRDRVSDDVRAALAGNAVQIEQEYRLCGKDERYRWFFSLMRVEYDAQMRPATMLRYCLDIADRKHAEDARAESERRLQAILDHSPPVSLKDPSGRYLLTNREFERVAGHARDAILGRTDDDLFAPSLARVYRANDRQVLEKNGGLEVEEVFLEGGEPHTYQSIKFPLWDAANRPYALCAISIDITERKKTNDALKMAQREAERANLAKSDFLSRMSHDLRTPLNAILGFAQLLELEDVRESAKESVGHILRGGQHLLALINEVLDIARIEAGHLSLSPEPVHAHEIVQLAMQLVRPLAVQRGITLVLETCSADIVVLADRQRLNQILLNLLSNAVKYNRQGGLVTVGFDTVTGGRTRISVTDTGAGIAAEKLELLFQPFARLGAERTAVEGTGLGLALSRGLAEAMGGALGVASVVDQGSTFWLELRITDGPLTRTDVAPPRAAADPASLPKTAGLVLYIEDNHSNVRLMERILERRPGVRLLHAPSGDDGLRMARTERPDLILLDLHLPDMSGDDVLRHLSQDEELRHIPVAMLSADATPAQARRLKASGAIAYLTKPLDIGEVMELLDERLGAVARQETDARHG
jgi:PAS domain S-box-containing protein